MANHAKACRRRIQEQADSDELELGLARANAVPTMPRQWKPWEGAGRYDHRATDAPRQPAAASSSRPPPPSSSNPQQSRRTAGHSRAPPGSIEANYLANYKRKAEIFEDHTAPTDARQSKKYRDSGANAPWHPFKTRSDFDFAELVLRACMTKEQINSLLVIIRRCIDGNDELTFQSYADLHDSVNKARHLVEPTCCRYCASFCRARVV